jgi:hypothetical protein
MISFLVPPILSSIISFLVPPILSSMISFLVPPILSSIIPFLVPPIQFWFQVLKVFSPVSLVFFHGSSNPFLVPPLDISSPFTLVFLQGSPNLILVSSSWYLQSSYKYLLIPTQSSFLVSIPPSWCSVPFLLGSPILSCCFPLIILFLELLRHPLVSPTPPPPALFVPLSHTPP